MMRFSVLVLVSVILSTNAVALAQDEDLSEVDQIESEIKIKSTEPKIEPEANVPLAPVEKLSDLSRLSSFEDISVIQKRYMPKTQRFSVSLGLSNIVNDPWFSNFGGGIKAAYFFSEAWGVELSASGFSSSKRSASEDLFNQHGVNTSSLVTTKSYTGGDVIWTPIYGKMARFNDHIVPFDMYFSLGGGTTSVDNGKGGSTLHLGTGQIFALSKNTGFRWDFSWLNFQATPTDRAAQAFNNLILTLGVSFYFPEADTR